MDLTLYCHRFRGKMLLAMNLTACMLLIAALGASARGVSQRVSLSGKDIPIERVFKEIKKQTGYLFLYDREVVTESNPVTINVHDASLETVLSEVFKGQPLEYTVMAWNILVKIKAASAPGGVSPAQSPPQEIFKGLVMAVDGKPLVGATVTIKGGGASGMTDELGEFTIKAKEGDVLVFSMVGMVSQEMVLGKGRILKVTLKGTVSKLDDLVIVGYGQQKKISVTGAIATVDMDDMQVPVRNLTDALAGKVAGIISMQTSGEPGYDNSQFTIRGIGTFTGNTSPLIIVDGVQRDDVNSTYAGAYNNIDPDDIASISLLKDASATAVYGALAANGVLIITTKRGVAGKPKISLKMESGLAGMTQMPKMADGVTYMKLYNEARSNMGQLPGYSQETIDKTASGLDPYLYPNVNWIDAIYKTWAPMYNGNLNVSGGGEAMRYYVSASFYDQDGSYKVSKLNGYNPNLNFKRYDFRSNIDINVTKSTLVSMNLDAMLVNSKYPGTSAASIWYNAYATNPVEFPIQYPGGLFAGPINNGGENPFNDVQNAGYTTEFHPTVQSVFTVDQKLDALTPGLHAVGRFSFDSYSEFDMARTGTDDLWYAGSRDADGNLILTQTRTGQQFLNYSQSSTGERTMYLESNLNYNHSFGKHTFGGLLLYNMRNRVVATGSTAIASIPYRNQSLAGRATYSYADRYLLEFDGGYTGSENFAPGHRFGFFPSVSGGWVISKEDFFKHLTGKINLLKIRGSHGVVGNDNIGTAYGSARFGYLTQIGPGNTASFGTTPTPYYGNTEAVLGNPDLTWELSTKDDIGLEVGILSKLNIVLDAYQDRRKHILINRQSISPIAGYSNLAIFANLGEMNNRGMDGSVEYKDRFGKDVSLRLFANFTYAKNKIVFQDEPTRIYRYQEGTGHQYGEFYGYTAEGLFKDQSDLNKSPVQSFGVTNPGDIKYKDMNGDGTIDGNDWSYLGKTPFPTLLYGMGFTVGYKKFDLSLMFQGVSGVSIMANGSANTASASTAPAAGSITGSGSTGVGVVPFAGEGQYPSNIISDVTNRWTVANPSQHVDYPRLSIASSSDNNYLGSTWWLKNGDYCRLKQASLGYTVSSRGIRRSGFTALYFYTSGVNLFNFTRFKLWDPELGSDGATYPPARTITFGVKAQL